MSNWPAFVKYQKAGSRNYPYSENRFTHVHFMEWHLIKPSSRQTWCTQKNTRPFGQYCIFGVYSAKLLWVRENEPEICTQVAKLVLPAGFWIFTLPANILLICLIARAHCGLMSDVGVGCHRVWRAFRGAQTGWIRGGTWDGSPLDGCLRWVWQRRGNGRAADQWSDWGGLFTIGQH